MQWTKKTVQEPFLAHAVRGLILKVIAGRAERSDYVRRIALRSDARMDVGIGESDFDQAAADHELVLDGAEKQRAALVGRRGSGRQEGESGVHRVGKIHQETGGKNLGVSDIPL